MAHFMAHGTNSGVGFPVNVLKPRHTPAPFGCASNLELASGDILASLSLCLSLSLSHTLSLSHALTLTLSLSPSLTLVLSQGGQTGLAVSAPCFAIKRLGLMVQGQALGV